MTLQVGNFLYFYLVIIKLIKLVVKNHRLSGACLEYEMGHFIDIFKQICDCPLPCEEMAYQLHTSATQWPSPVGKVADCAAKDSKCIERYR